ncbi:unnamed protein product [Symbiodinium sp. CCMP2592]|nr:unnamed protein product [Symbiodinium sp. CCMP2592]
MGASQSLEPKRTELGELQSPKTTGDMCETARTRTAFDVSRQHLRALSGAGLDEHGAPSAEQFAKLAEHRGRRKLTQMQDCLGQACIEADLQLLLQPGSLVIHQDVSAMLLMMRFSMCSENLTTAKGLLGVAHLQDGSNASLQAGARAIVMNVCQGDESAFDTLRGNVELIDTDAAADEQLAARLMRISAGLFPNSKVAMKDRTHAARRLMSRPFKAINELDEVYSTLISGSSSITRTIQSSQVLSNAFAGYCARVESSAVKSKRIKNLSFRKHRFDSFQKPTSRMILWFEAVIMTAVHASVHRKDDRDGQRARDFLEYISEERMLLLAMAADFSDETTALIRMLDSEEHDVSAVMLEVDVFASRLRTLFLQERVLHSGYTEHMMRQLQEPVAFMIGAQPKTIGGSSLPAATVQRCLKVMKSLVALCLEVLESEFPNIQLLAAFRIFDLSHQSRSCRADSSDRAQSTRDAAERLCQAFEVDCEAFLAEYEDHRPIAQHHAICNKDASSFQAWKTAVQKTSARSSTATRHPSSNLAWILMRLGSFDGCTTSGVEQHFARMRKIITPDRSGLGEETMNYELKFMFDYDRLGPASINKLAAEVWLSWFGKPRNGSTSRLDKGVKRSHKDSDGQSQAAFVARRRQKVQEEMVLCDPNDIKAEALEAAQEHMENCDSIQNELLFQQTKQYKNQIQSYLDGHLLASEVDPELEELAEDWVKHQDKLDAERQRAASRRHAIMAPAAPQLLNHWIFLEDESWGQCPELQGQNLSGDLPSCKFFVVKDPARPGQRVTWVATLQGGCICDIRFMKYLAGQRERQQGVAFLYDAAVSTRRKVFVCPQFRAHHAILAGLVDRAASQQHSKWKLLNSWQQFAEAHGKVSAKNPLAVVALTVPAVCDDMASRNIMTKTSFIAQFRAMSCASRGACGA